MMRPDTFTRVRRGTQIADEPDNEPDNEAWQAIIEKVEADIGPLVRLGPGGRYTRDVYGADIARISPLRGALSGFGRAVLRHILRRRR